GHTVHTRALYFVTFIFSSLRVHRDLHSFPTRRSSDLFAAGAGQAIGCRAIIAAICWSRRGAIIASSDMFLNRAAHRSRGSGPIRSEEHTSELQSRENLVCRLLLEKKKRQQ